MATHANRIRFSFSVSFSHRPPFNPLSGSKAVDNMPMTNIAIEDSRAQIASNFISAILAY